MGKYTLILILLLSCRARAAEIVEMTTADGDRAEDKRSSELLLRDERISGPGAARTELNIALQKLQMLRRRKGAVAHEIGMFTNATSQMVSIESEIPGGASAGSLVRPGESTKLEIAPGGRITVSDWSSPQFPKPILFTTIMRIPVRKADDRLHREFRFVVHQHSLEAVH
jgi:hypothetical protein